MKKLFLLLVLMVTAYSSAPGEIRWVAIGDSITYLNEHPDETGNRITKGYMTRVTEQSSKLSLSEIHQYSLSSGKG